MTLALGATRHAHSAWPGHPGGLRRPHPQFAGAEVRSPTHLVAASGRAVADAISDVRLWAHPTGMEAISDAPAP